MKDSAKLTTLTQFGGKKMTDYTHNPLDDEKKVSNPPYVPPFAEPAKEPELKSGEIEPLHVTEAKAAAERLAAPPAAPVVHKEVLLTPKQHKLKELKDALLADIQEILKDHGGIESNIGIGHPYWDMQNRLRSM
jgi:hypothetical protein